MIYRDSKHCVLRGSYSSDFKFCKLIFIQPTKTEDTRQEIFPHQVKKLEFWIALILDRCALVSLIFLCYYASLPEHVRSHAM